mmetsp:Transcript_36010/g.57534  ORF Transcript_36010/g.57534 Transcript_36010/m.57534 type:complete len:116 (-) Transcript_36010:13-360(-)
MLQGALMLLEENVTVQCRQCDTKLVESCLKAVADEYSVVIKRDTGKDKKCNFTIDTSKYLPPPPQADSTAKSCLGGVILACQNGTIVIDNTIDLRLRLVLEQDKPAIRDLLFPVR